MIRDVCVVERIKSGVSVETTNDSRRGKVSTHWTQGLSNLVNGFFTVSVLL